MTTNITTLALNLLISERPSQRVIFSDRIVELLHQNNTASETDQELRNYFLAVMAQCVENPTSEGRDFFYQTAQFYNMKINGVSGEVSLAA